MTPHDSLLAAITVCMVVVAISVAFIAGGKFRV